MNARHLQNIPDFRPRPRSMFWLGILLFWSLLPPPVSAQSLEMRELYRIRFINREGGPVDVCEAVRRGGRYHRVGTVTRAAAATALGFSASVYAPPGAVAATAVHGIRIKVSGERGCRRGDARIISILPKEFAASPKGFGGHIAGMSGIHTDVPAGKAIFRNLAPFVGNQVLLTRGGAQLPLPSGYTPRDGDELIVVVCIPARYPKEIIVENHRGGRVEAVYAGGREIVGRVERPVTGVGRFDATAYTGVGRINTNHAGVLTISTAPVTSAGNDGSRETRGGFMIQPSRHARDAKEVSQVLVVGPASPGAPPLEGSPPLFSGCIGLAHDPAREENSFRVDVKTSDSDWRPLPPLVGRSDAALMKLPNGAVTHIRIRFPAFSADWVRAEIERCRSSYLDVCRARALRNGTIATGPTVDFRLDPSISEMERVRLTCLYVDGRFRGASDTPEHTFSLNIENWPEGEHIVELRGIDAGGGIVKRVRKTFFVQSPRAASEGR